MVKGKFEKRVRDKELQNCRARKVRVSAIQRKVAYLALKARWKWNEAVKPPKDALWSSGLFQVEKICQRLTEEWKQPPLLCLLLPTASSDEALTALDALSDRGILRLGYSYKHLHLKVLWPHGAARQGSEWMFFLEMMCHLLCGLFRKDRMLMPVACSQGLKPLQRPCIVDRRCACGF